MGSHVLLQMSLLPKGPRAEIAFERFGARGDHRVNGQVARRSEHLATHLTTVTLLAVALSVETGATAAVSIFAQIRGQHILVIIVRLSNEIGVPGRCSCRRPRAE